MSVVSVTRPLQHTAMSDSRKPHSIRLSEKIRSINAIANKSQTVESVAAELGVSQSLVSHWYKNRCSLRAKWSHVLGTDEPTTADELERYLCDWYLDCIGKERKVTSAMISERANIIHSELTGEDDFWPSQAWAMKFKTRFKLVNGISGKKGSNYEPLKYVFSLKRNEGNSKGLEYSCQKKGASDMPLPDPPSDNPLETGNGTLPENSDPGTSTLKNYFEVIKSEKQASIVININTCHRFVNNDLSRGSR